jgi:hypothetical protein
MLGFLRPLVQLAKFQQNVGAAICTINIGANIWLKNGKGVSTLNRMVQQR